MNRAAPIAAALSLALAACAPHVPTPHRADTGAATAPAPRTCGAGNPLCADGGRPPLVILEPGVIGFPPTATWRPVKGGR